MLEIQQQPRVQTREQMRMSNWRRSTRLAAAAEETEAKEGEVEPEEVQPAPKPTGKEVPATVPEAMPPGQGHKEVQTAHQRNVAIPIGNMANQRGTV